jgi:AhpD family alkylhydroperoxidase
MTTRLSPFTAAPNAIKAMLALQAYVSGCGLEPTLAELVKVRASQINGCAFCLDMHTREARAAGESEQRLYVLPAWAESMLYTSRERAALAWTEALTLIAETHAPDAAYEALLAVFSEEDAVNLTLLIGAINIWNRIAIGFRTPVPDRKTSA